LKSEVANTSAALLVKNSLAANAITLNFTFFFNAAMSETWFGKTYNHSFCLSVGSYPDQLHRICDSKVFRFKEEDPLKEEEPQKATKRKGYYCDLALYSGKKRFMLDDKSAPSNPESSPSASPTASPPRTRRRLQ
jgi:hypothetical protein